MNPRRLILIRHGESTGNLARERAEAAGAETIAVECRDADVPLSPLGRTQAEAVGRELSVFGPSLISAWTSPYLRARQTARVALDVAGLSAAIGVDERLRDRELGVLDTLTTHGVLLRYPLEAERRQWLGKFYYRPPGGESWADLALRLRSFLDVLERRPLGTSCLFTHDAVITMCRYVCQNLDEEEVLAVARENPIANASVSVLTQSNGDGSWFANTYNGQDHLVDDAGRDLRTAHPGDLDVHPR